MTRVIGVNLDDQAVAVTAERLERDRALAAPVGGRELAVWWQSGTGSALDAATVADGLDVGTTAVFDPRLDERTHTFEPVEGGGFRDVETGSTWNIFGTATAGPLVVRQLQAVPHVDTFWFAWAAFRPDTTILA